MKEKRVFQMPGQSMATPEEKDSTRMFYEQLRKQIPGSAMAEVWLYKRGLLPLEDAQRIFDSKKGDLAQEELAQEEKAVLLNQKRECAAERQRTAARIVKVQANRAASVTPLQHLEVLASRAATETDKLKKQGWQCPPAITLFGNGQLDSQKDQEEVDRILASWETDDESD